MLFRITLDTNPEDCNLHCVMCEEHSNYSTFKQQLFEQTHQKRRIMPLETIEKIFNEAKLLGVKEIIPSTMGEPLLYDNIETFFNLAKKFDIKINLTTNGTFPKKNVEYFANLIIPVTSDTKFSVNGATKNTAESIMQGLDFDKQTANIRKFTTFRNEYFRETNFYSRASFQLTFMQNNMHEIADIIKLAADLDIDRIKGHHLWTHFPEIEDFSFRKNKNSIAEWNNLVDKAKIAIEKYRKPNGQNILLQQFDYLSEIESKNVPEEYNCPFLGKELWISATGKISPCCAPDNLRQTLGDFGFYPQISLNDALQSENYKLLLKNYKNYYVCKNCVMRKK